MVMGAKVEEEEVVVLQPLRELALVLVGVEEEVAVALLLRQQPQALEAPA